MKDIIGKSKVKLTNLRRKPKIAAAFNDFFTNIDQKLTSQTPKSSKTFEAYVNKVNIIMDSKPFTINKLKDSFFSLKINKS